MDKELIDAPDDSLLTYTASVAEGVNQVLFSCFLEISRKTGKCHFVTSAIEDAPTMQMMHRLEELGCFVKIAPVNARGEIDVTALNELITARTALVTLTVANGLTGVVQPTEEIAKLCKAKDVLLHLDATHALDKLHFSMKETSADYVTFGNDRIGALYSKKGAPLVPIIFGGKNFEKKRFSKETLKSFEEEVSKKVSCIDQLSLELPRLRYRFESQITKSIPGAKVVYPKSLTLPSTTVITFPSANQDALCFLLKESGVNVDLGGEYSQNLFSQLLASNVDPLDAYCSISFCITPEMTTDDINEVVQKVTDAVSHLTSIAPKNLETYPVTTYFEDIKAFKKIKEKAMSLKFAGSFSDEEATSKGMRLAVGKGKGLSFYLLVDPTDGEIADVRFQAFGPATLLALGEVIAELVIRKDISQAARLSADLIEKQLIYKQNPLPKPMDGLINQGILAIDEALMSCQDIECVNTEYETTPIAWESEGEALPNWAELPQDQKLQLIEEIIEKEIRPYIELDAGGIQIVELKENDEIIISYEGACTTCPSATGSTLSAIQNILNSRLSPTLTVTPHFHALN